MPNAAATRRISVAAPARPRLARRALAAALAVAVPALALASGALAQELPPPDPAAPPVEPIPLTPVRPAVPLVRVTVEGTTLEPRDRLARFLGLVPGALYDEALEHRVAVGLTALGYVVVAPTTTPVPGGLDLHLRVEPARLVRHVRVKGNWPILRAIFNEDIIRRLTLRPGARLPPQAELPGLLEQESRRVREYLHREGFFNGDAIVVTHPAGGRPEWVDIDVIMHIGPWFDLGHVEPKGNLALTKEQLADPFVHNFPPSYFSRFRVDRMHDDARKAEQLYRDAGFPAARVFPEFDANIDVDRKSEKVRLRLRVAEKGRVKLHFIGNNHIPEKDLIDKVTIFNAGSYDETELVESARELHRFYQSRGFLEARVTFRRQRSGDVHDITFFVDEGPELKIRGIEFVADVGAASAVLSFDSKELQRQISTKVFPSLIGEIGLGEGGYVTSVQLAQDAERLVAFYHSRGFPEARVRGALARDPAAFDSAGTIGADVASGWGRGQDLYLRFYVDEGRREVVDSVAIRFVQGSTRSQTEAALAQAVRIAPGDPYVPDAVTTAVKRVLALYATRGHPWARVDLRPSNHTDHRYRIVLLIDEGPPVRFGEILVRGNFRTAEWVIRRDLPFKPGDLYDTAKIDRATRNLNTHTIFNSVRVAPVPADLPPGTSPIPILVEVQERYDNWGSFEAAIGYATDVGATGSAAYFWGNVLGGGGQLELRGDVAVQLIGANTPFLRLASGTARYVHPHLFHPSLRGELSGFARQETTPALGEIQSLGARFALTWTPYIWLRVFSRFEFTNSTLQAIDFQRVPSRGDDRVNVQDETSIAKVTLGAVWDDRVSFKGARIPLMPISGSLLAAQISGSPILSHKFITLSLQAQRYQPLFRRRPTGDDDDEFRDIILIANFRGDWGFPLGGDTALPAVERFFAGGDDKTRGYDTDRLRTEIVQGDVSPAPIREGLGAGYRVVPQGGNVRFLATLELQFPIGTIGSFPWVGAVFFDAGTIFDSIALFDPVRDIKYSVGVTLLRLLTPVGPLSLEYAYPITQTLAEESWKKETWGHWPGRIHFNWGIPILR